MTPIPSQAATPMRWVWGSVGLCAALWVVWNAPEDPPTALATATPPTRPQMATPTGTPTAPAPVLGLAWGPVRPGEGTDPSAADIPAADRGGITPRVVDLCGLGRMTLSHAHGASDAALAAQGAQDGALEADRGAGLDALPAPVGREALGRVRERMLAALHNGDASARTAALVLSRPALVDDTVQQAWAHSLLLQAMASQNPAALAWAETACAALPQGSACRLQLIRERLRLEPDNAHHWAALADEDPSAADEAWQGLLQSQRWHESPQSLLLLSQAALASDVPAYLRQALAVEVQQQTAALPSPGEGFVQERCREPTPGRQPECDQLTRLLSTQGDSLRALSQAAQLAPSAGWSPQQQRALKQELRALNSPGLQWAPDTQQPLSCASLEGWQQQMADISQRGELATLRARRAQALALAGITTDLSKVTPSRLHLHPP